MGLKQGHRKEIVALNVKIQSNKLAQNKNKNVNIILAWQKDIFIVKVLSSFNTTAHSCY